MGSLIRENRYRILLTSFALILIVGVLTPPTVAANNVEARKLHRLQALGLDTNNPTIVKAADSAHALHSVDVYPRGDDINIVLQLSGLPSYDSYIYENKRRLVVDLFNTINIAPSSAFDLGSEDPIRCVRNAQYKVDPAIISRVVVELEENVTPDITAEGSNLVISAPMGAQSISVDLTPVELPIENLKPVSHEEIEVAAIPTEDVDSADEQVDSEQDMDAPAEEISAPVADVDTGTPEVEMVVARATTEVEAPAEAVPATEQVEEAEQSVVEFVDMDPAAEDVEPVETPAKIEAVSVEQEAREAVVEIIEEAEEVAAIEEPAEPEVAEVVEAEIEEPVEQIEVVEVQEEPEPPILMAAVDIEQVEEITTEPAEVEEPEAVESGEAARALNGMFSEMAAPEKTERIEMAKAIMPAAPEPQESVEAAEPIASGQDLITLIFRDADLNAVLDIVARKGNLNIIAGKDIKGTVTVRLVDVPLDVALNAILNINGYGYLKTNNIIRILPLSEIGEVANTETETYKLSYAKAGDAKKTLESFLTKNGNIETDKRTNMLVVTDVPGNVQRIAQLIEQIDTRVQQVLIEVIILDSILLDDADLGVSWGLLNTNDDTFNSKQALADDADSPYPDQIGINLPTGANALNVVYGTLLGGFDLNVFIDAVVSDTDSRVLANPKVLTLNNETAKIEIVQEYPYNDVTQTSSGGQLSNITFKEIGTKLEVKPQITHDEHVILWVSPEQNSIAGATTIGVPIVDTRKAETTLIVKNHQTIVMGGLRENRNVNTLTKVPLLGDIPGVKYAFRNVQSDKQDTELLVFLTVHIVESSVLMPEERIKAEELANMPRHPNSTIELIRP